MSKNDSIGLHWHKHVVAMDLLSDIEKFHAQRKHEVEKIHSDNMKWNKQCESYLIFELKTLTPHGLNDDLLSVNCIFYSAFHCHFATVKVSLSCFF